MASERQLIVVASCTQRKTAKVPPGLHLRRFAGRDRVRRWCRALGAAEVPTVPAAELYGGDFFSIVRDLPKVANTRGVAATLFIASAGYGLVEAQARLKPYSATFADGPDSTMSGLNGGADLDTHLREWWEGVSRWNGPGNYRGPRTVTQVAQRTPEASILVIASPRYVRAMRHDLESAAKALDLPESLAIVSSTVGFPKQLERHLVPSVGSFQSELGGTMGSLHARTARDLVQRAAFPLNADNLRVLYLQMAARIGPRTNVLRQTRSDAQVRAFIKSRARRHGQLSCTALLRLHRDSGYRCEQKRFRSLYTEVVES